MTKRARLVLALAAAALLVVGVVAMVVVEEAVVSEEAECAAQLKADKSMVRTSQAWTEDDLPGIGDYVEIHWQADTAANPCSRAPGPTEWSYQGVVRMRLKDARALAERYDWQPVSPSPPPGTYVGDTPGQMWPALVPFAPANGRWLHSADYSSKHLQHKRWGDLYLDPDNGVAFFSLHDH